MNLISGHTPWKITMPHPPSYPVLQQDITCECLIVGGGMSGAAAAYHLSTAGAETVLIDKRPVGSGSTHANTGLLQVSNDKTLTACMNTFGEADGVLFYRLCREALNRILALPGELDIDPQIYSRDSLYYASTAEDTNDLRIEYDNLIRHGFECEWWEKERIGSSFSFSKPAGIYSRNDAEANPLRMVHSLIAKAVSRGIRVFECTEAVHYEFNRDGVVCFTRNGRIFAKNVIFAMGYETQEMKKDRAAELVNTYALMTRPLPEPPKWHKHALLWETARPYHYFRLTSDNRIVAGGKDEPLTDPERREVRVLSQCKRLLEEVAALFPETKGIEAEFTWGAVFGSTHDGLPLIGPHPRFPHCCFVEGYGGNGTVYSMIAADLLADKLAGKSRPELELFSLTRSTKPSPDNHSDR
ncbi:NAD(P)/FAD-dependent oxidoreductase [Paenibacillus rhizophilus]|uniref:FAD-binding oxidoreductase n=1 Tax=Paenibacillus rhizophilus TaxID=1850366 RepID=A0A3N9Q5C7_9BACL|nr:FAD-dependent oxidoreductase [Paenibacillus rhizophilus]RQW12706.1 FAD-binding oxidoreductase [Paenibacillus rhizophilus]